MNIMDLMKLMSKCSFITSGSNTFLRLPPIPSSSPFWIYKTKKEKTQNNLTSIEIEDENNSNIYAFNKNIGILNKNNFKIYNNAGKEEKELTLEISKPIFNQSNRYLAVAEEKGQKIYLIADKDILCERNRI